MQVIFIQVQWGMLQQMNATMDSFYQNQDATTNMEEYYWPT
jgi:hypothetical protein